MTHEYYEGWRPDDQSRTRARSNSFDGNSLDSCQPRRRAVTGVKQTWTIERRKGGRNRLVQSRGMGLKSRRRKRRWRWSLVQFRGGGEVKTGSSQEGYRKGMTRTEEVKQLREPKKEQGGKKTERCHQAERDPSNSKNRARRKVAGASVWRQRRKTDRTA